MQRAHTTQSFDKRVRRTQAAIKSSFLELAAQKPFTEITVKEIMQLAKVNRATFYAHFSNIEELACAVELDYARQLTSQYEEALRTKTARTAPAETDLALECALANPEALRWVVGPSSTGEGRDLLRAYARSRWAAGTASETDDLAFEILFNGCADLLGTWAQDGEKLNEEQVKSAVHSVMERFEVEA